MSRIGARLPPGLGGDKSSRLMSLLAEIINPLDLHCDFCQETLEKIFRPPLTPISNRMDGVHIQIISRRMTSLPQGLKNPAKPMGEIFKGLQGKK